MSKRTISVADVLNAMELDNVPLARGTWFRHGAGELVAEACILGQCAVNLGVTAAGIERVLNVANPGSSNTIIGMNDGLKPYADMIKMAKQLLAGKEDISVEVDSYFYMSKLKEPAK